MLTLVAYVAKDDEEGQLIFFSGRVGMRGEFAYIQSPCCAQGEMSLQSTECTTAVRLPLAILFTPVNAHIG